MTRKLLSLALLAWVVPSFALAQCPDLEPIDDGSGTFGAVGLPALVISEVNPGDYIEVFNTTGSTITLPGIYWFCSMFQYGQVAVSIPAGSYATIPWLPSFTFATDAGGEMMLYKSNSFGTNVDILDYVIWGAPGFSRKTQAEAVGKWVGANAGALTGAIHRNIGVEGNEATEYDIVSAPSPENCTPAPTGVGDIPVLTGARVWNTPNPFSGNTDVEFVLDTAGSAELAIYAIDGSLVRKFDSKSFPAGLNRFSWNGTDSSGRKVVSGTYLARVSGGVTATARLTLVR